jgi:hypothetical protein
MKNEFMKSLSIEGNDVVILDILDLTIEFVLFFGYCGLFCQGIPTWDEKIIGRKIMSKKHLGTKLCFSHSEMEAFFETQRQL